MRNRSSRLGLVSLSTLALIAGWTDLRGFMFRVGVEAAALRYDVLGQQKPTLVNVGIFPWPYLSLGASF